ncbi:hypothetical protein N7448_009204 [Penicillium atrosanguineum]|nr:hypothetical protein N7448_009204 [Penicillium atrosanguineum]KAJ5141738.1 hypothetical protein N7526_002733 [Penicillium atrosanguineum]
MASSSIFYLGDIILVNLPGDNTKCFGTTVKNENCDSRLGKDKRQAAKKILQHAIAYEDLSGGLAKEEIKDLAQILVKCKHDAKCREKLQNKWLSLFEKHRKNQMATQQQPLDTEATPPLPITPEDIETSDITEPSTVQDPITKGQVAYPVLRIPDPEESATEVPERLEVLPLVSLRSAPESLPAYHPTIHEDLPISLSSNWILSYMIGFVMQIGKNVLAMMFVRFGSVSTQDQAGRITKPVTHLKFLLGFDFTIRNSRLGICMYTLVLLALFRLFFSVLWPLSGYVVGGYFVLLAVSGAWNRKVAIEE